MDHGTAGRGSSCADGTSCWRWRTARELKIGVVGIGFGRFHANCLAAMPGVNLAGVAGRERSDLGVTVAEFAERHGAKAYSSGAELIEGGGLDAVVIAVPPGRLALAEAAVARGTAVLLEKPLASDRAEAEALVELSDHGFVGVNFEMRQLPAVMALRGLLADGVLGAVRMIEVSYVSGPPPDDSWILRFEYGGPLVENSCHAFDLVQMLGGRVERVFAEAAGRTRSGVPLGASVVMGLGDGRSAAATVGSVAVDELGVPLALTVYGEYGQASVHGEFHEFHTLRWGLHGREATEIEFGAPAVSHLEIGTFDCPTLIQPALDEFVARVADGRAPAVSARDAMPSFEISMAVLESIERGVAVNPKEVE